MSRARRDPVGLCANPTLPDLVRQDESENDEYRDDLRRGLSCCFESCPSTPSDPIARSGRLSPKAVAWFDRCPWDGPLQAPPTAAMAASSVG